MHRARWQTCHRLVLRARDARLDSHVRHAGHAAAPSPGAVKVTSAKVSRGMIEPIDIDIYQPTQAASHLPVILNFSHGIPEVPDRTSSRILAMTANAIVIQPRESLFKAPMSTTTNKKYHFPAQIHSTLAIFNWIAGNIDGQERAPRAANEGHASYGVCGELLGANLATTLAITECHLGQPHIGALYTRNPILNWTDVFSPGQKQINWRALDLESASDAPTGTVTQPFRQALSTLTYTTDKEVLASSLAALRALIFAKPGHILDPFANPNLFFRNPQFNLSVDDFYTLKQAQARARSSSRTSLDEVFLPTDAQPRATAVAFSAETDLQLDKIKLVRRGYPPIKSDLLLPQTRIVVDHDFSLRRQATELIKFMRKSMRRPKEIAAWLAEVEKEQGDAGRIVDEDRFELEQRKRTKVRGRKKNVEGPQLESWSSAWTDDLQVGSAGSWLGTTLRRPAFS